MTRADLIAKLKRELAMCDIPDQLRTDTINSVANETQYTINGREWYCHWYPSIYKIQPGEYRLTTATGQPICILAATKINPDGVAVGGIVFFVVEFKAGNRQTLRRCDKSASDFFNRQIQAGGLSPVASEETYRVKRRKQSTDACYD